MMSNGRSMPTIYHSRIVNSKTSARNSNFRKIRLFIYTEPNYRIPLIAHFRRESEDGSTYNSDTVFLVTDPWREKEKKVSHTGVVFRAPRKTNLQ